MEKVEEQVDEEEPEKQEKQEKEEVEESEIESPRKTQDSHMPLSKRLKVRRFNWNSIREGIKVDL